MEKEKVIEFLGCVPLLQRLPSASLRKVSELVVFKHYEQGEYVVREGEPGDGMYFIWEGQAEVVGSLSVNDENRREFQLKRCDYFGCGLSNTVHPARVVATCKLTCLVLPHEHLAMLQSESIWTCSPPVEDILHLEPMPHLDDIFQGITLPGSPHFGKVFGGQLIGQALVAASKSADHLKVVHSFHAYFILAGDLNIPIIYKVHRLRDGKSFATRNVDAIQKGKLIFTLMASFQKEEPGFDHQEVAMPLVPAPDTLLPMEELRERRLTDARFPIAYRNKVATTEFIPWPIEIRFCEAKISTNMTKSPPSFRYWFRAKGKLSDDQALHRCVVAYASDLIFLQVSLNPHRSKGFRTRSVSLDHSMWFHRPIRADDWVLFWIFTPTSNNARGYVTGHMFNQKGELLVSLVQEGLARIRTVNSENSAIKPKL
ncbi:putative thiolester hydrolase [Lupinus albus]|uniref:acyl-CoA hydrolase n=1 Tax=Lupinus albus TaxID=3870 RepID=A0A6A4NTF5_LUPAL|nr:putative thiolester hydrolase [Lupinus albus]